MNIIQKLQARIAEAEKLVKKAPLDPNSVNYGIVLGLKEALQMEVGKE